MAQAAYRLGFVLLAAAIALPAGAQERSAGNRNIADERLVPFNSVAPDVVVPPGEEDQSDPGDGNANDDRGGGNAGPPDDSAPISQSANGTDNAIPA
jgi:hypothetical protein